MNETIRLLNAVRDKLPRGSDYAVAQALGISRSRMSHYMKGDNAIEDEATIMRAATIAGIKPESAFISLMIDKTKLPEARDAWLRVSKLVEITSTDSAVAA